jgi:hypothetical protein
MTQKVDDPSSSSERADRAARIAAMLARWEKEKEDVSGEPAWDIDDIEPLRFSGYVTGEPKTQSP